MTGARFGESVSAFCQFFRTDQRGAKSKRSVQASFPRLPQTWSEQPEMQAAKLARVANPSRPAITFHQPLTQRSAQADAQEQPRSCRIRESAFKHQGSDDTHQRRQKENRRPSGSLRHFQRH